MWIDAISNRELETQQRNTGNTSIKDELLHHCREAQKSCVSSEQVETGVRWGNTAPNSLPALRTADPDFKFKHLLPPERLAQFARGMQGRGSPVLERWAAQGKLLSQPSQALLSCQGLKPHGEHGKKQNQWMRPCQGAGSAAGPKGASLCSSCPTELGKPRGQGCGMGSCWHQGPDTC